MAEKPKLRKDWRNLPYTHPERVAYRNWKKEQEKDSKKAKSPPAPVKDIEKSNFEQAVLTRNIDKAVNYFTANSNLFNYRTFRQVNGNGAQLVNRLRGVDNLGVFYKIKTSVLSLMRPKIRLYKVSYEDFNSIEGRPDQGSVTVLPQPRYREFKFSDTIGTERVASVQDYLSYESTKPSWRNVGLESFSVDRDGRIAGPVQKDLKCTLSLSFKSLKDIQASPPGEPPPEQGGLRYSDLITWPAAKLDAETETYNPKHYEIKILIGYTAPSAEQLRNLNLSASDIDAIKNIERFNTMIALGLFSYDFKINDDGSVKLKAEYRGRIETTISSNQVNIFDNTISLRNTDGSVKSKQAKNDYNISNVYKILTFLNSLGIQLNKPSCKDDTCQARKTLKSFIEDDNFFSSIVKETFQDGSGKIIKEAGILQKGEKLQVKTSAYDFFKEEGNISKLQTNIKNKMGLFKKETFASFVDQLIVGNDDKGAGGTRLFCINIDSKETNEALGIEDDSSDTAAGCDEIDDKTDTAGVAGGDTAKFGSECEKPSMAASLGSAGVKIDRCHKMPIDSLAAVSKNMQQDIGTALRVESESKDQKSGDKPKEDPGRAPIRNFSGKSHRFYFVYLGDIVELACKNAGLKKLDLKSGAAVRNEGFSIFGEKSYFSSEEGGSGYPLTNTRMLLGPVEYKDRDNKIKAINLAQLPISFNLFRSWFINKVVRRSDIQMTLGTFLNRLINDLAMPSLGIGMPKNFRPPKTRVNFVSLTLPGRQTKAGKLEETLPKNQIINTDGSVFQEEYFSRLKDSARSSESMIKNSFDYLFIHISTHKDIKGRRGDPSEDLKDGIYHFNIGSDMGLLKNMKFAKIGIPGMAAARSRESETQGTDSLDQLKFPYNTDLVLIGTTLFTPGMFYYVNPSLAGLGSIEDSTSLAYKLNLGGYHLIMTTKITLTPQKFETTITGMQLR